jgi:hypothetical protein
MPMLAFRRSKPLLFAAVLALIAVASLANLASAAPNPPGNNGTIKIDDTPFDDAPDNEPHVGCVFQVDFYGYDEGDLDATVTFESHPPTGPVRVLLTDTVFIGEDDNSGGGSQAGLDASETYTLDPGGIEPHPNQGFHVKLTVNAEGSQGADVKHKVFWVTGCVLVGAQQRRRGRAAVHWGGDHDAAARHRPRSARSGRNELAREVASRPDIEPRAHPQRRGLEAPRHSVRSIPRRIPGWPRRSPCR